MTKSRKAKTPEAKNGASIKRTVPSRKQKPATPLKAAAGERKSAKPDRKASETTNPPSLLSNLSPPLRLPAGLIPYEPRDPVELIEGHLIADLVLLAGKKSTGKSQMVAHWTASFTD